MQLKEGERIKAYLPVRQFDDQHFIMMCTKQGTVKKTSLEEFSNPRSGGIRAISINDVTSLSMQCLPTAR